MVWQAELIRKVQCWMTTILATPPMRKPPSAPTHPFHHTPSNVGKAKLISTASKLICRCCHITSGSFFRSGTLSNGGLGLGLESSQPAGAGEKAVRIVDG